jgi:hypothetical protein
MIYQTLHYILSSALQNFHSFSSSLPLGFLL